MKRFSFRFAPGSVYRWARSREPIGFAHRVLFGFVCGFLLLGPVCFAGWLLLLRWTPGRLIPPDPFFAGPEATLSMRDPGPLLVARVRAANRDRRALVVGSSEFGDGGATPCTSVPCLLAGLAAQSRATQSKAPIPVHFAGSAVLRAAVLLDRLETYRVYPGRLLVVVNPHYAFGGNSFGGDALPAFFPDLDAWEYHRPRRGNDESRRNLPALESQWAGGSRRAFAPGGNRMRILEVRQARNLLHRMVRRAGSASPSPPSGIAAGGYRLSPESLRRYQSDLPGTPFDESLVFLTRKIKAAAGLRVDLVVLPLNRQAVGAAGLPGETLENAYTRLIEERLSNHANIRFLSELRDPALYADPIHFNARGRRQLALIIRGIATAIPGDG